MSKMSNVNRRPAWVSLRQLELLGKFLNSNKDIIWAYNKKKQEKEYTHKKWIEITAKLNAVSDGVHKDWKGWSKYWVDYKAKLKRKVAAIRASQAQNGGEPSTEHSLSEIDTKFLSILGENFGQDLPILRVEPFAQDPNNVQPERIELELSEDSPLYENAGQFNAEDSKQSNTEEFGQFEDFGQSNADFGQSNAEDSGSGQSNAEDSAQSNIEDSGQSNIEETRNESSLIKKAQKYRKRRRNTSDPTDRMIDFLKNRRKYKKTSSLSNDEKVDVKCDRLDLLFLGYADTVRKLSKQKQVKVKFDISRILMESEICDID